MDYEDKIKLLEEELKKTKEHLKSYTAPKRSKIYYENNKEEIKRKVREYKERINYNSNIPKDKKKEYNKIAYQKRKEKLNREKDLGVLQENLLK